MVAQVRVNVRETMADTSFWFVSLELKWLFLFAGNRYHQYIGLGVVGVLIEIGGLTTVVWGGGGLHKISYEWVE